MGLILFSGKAGSGAEEAARLTALRLPSWELVTAERVASLLAEEFGAVPEAAWGAAVTSVVARSAMAHGLILCVPGVERLFSEFPSVLRVRVEATAARRAGRIMLDRRLERPAAEALLAGLDGGASVDAAFGVTFDEALVTPEQMALMVSAAAVESLLEASREAAIQFEVRLRLAEHGLTPLGKASARKKPFANRSEEIFANLLDFYRIPWEYEPRTFVLSEEGNGEAFTPDFYLPDADLYVELTTMKQKLVTKKNRKVKMLRERYPQINIQVFYQRDFQNLIFKHGVDA